MQSYPILSLEKVYLALGYYLAHRETIDACIQRMEQEAEQARQDIVADYTPEQRARHARLKALQDAK